MSLLDPPQSCTHCEYGHIIEVDGTRLCDECGREVDDA